MTDPHHPDPDELASAHLDGETSPEEAARVDADPDLRDRVEELRDVQAAVRAPVTTDASRREAAITAALAAFAEDEAPTPAVRGTVTPLAPRRSPSPRAAQVLRVAAIVLLVALLIPVALSLGDGGSDDEASFDSTGAAISGGDDRASESGGEAAPEEDAGLGAAPSGAVVDLGSFDDLDALAEAAGARAADEQASRGSGTTTADAAFTPAPDCRPDAEGIRARAVVAGEPVLVLIAEVGDGQALTVLSEDCVVLEERRI
jgi:hypothetical protein